MRLYMTLEEAISEIKRDLAKSPRFISERVQNIQTSEIVHEAMNYEYTIDHGIPTFSDTLGQVGAKHFSLWKHNRDGIIRWLDAELHARLYPEAISPAVPPADCLHPVLKDMMEGRAFGYTYAERLIGMTSCVLHALQASATTRRVFWPVFRPEDAIRAASFTRIPCTLGAQFMLRPNAGAIGGQQLHMTLIQRSVDFNKFWLSDVYLWRQIQENYASQLGVSCGQFSHFICSFHFFEDGTEIY